MTLYALSRLLRDQHTGIDSFIFFVPNMRVAVPEVARQFHFWTSGRSRQDSNAVEPEYLKQLSEGWLSFLGRTTGEEVTRLDGAKAQAVKSMRYIR